MAEPLYTRSRQEAVCEGRLDKWERSREANIECARDVESLIASHTRDGTLEPGCAGEALERWGFLRVRYVLSNTLTATGSLGFEPDSLRWARYAWVAPGSDNEIFRVQADRPLLAQFLRQTYAEYQALGLFGADHCAPGHLDYTDKVLILRPDALKEECWSLQNQLWYAETGFGCSPNAMGQAVFAVCLGDGEKARWSRSDFIGVLDEKYLPDWAAEKLSELRGSGQEPTDGPAQGGMEMR